MSEAFRSELEERVVGAVRDGRDELVALVSDLVAFDTTARNVGDPPRQEAELQAYLRRRLEALGAEVDVWEPEPTGTGNRFVPDGLDFAGRPQLAAHAARRGRRPLPAAQRSHRRRLRRARRPVDQPPAQARGPRRPALRTRQLRHEGRHRRHALRARDAAPARRASGRRRRLLHEHRRGVERRRLVRLRRPRRARRRRPLRRADGVRRLGRLPRRREPRRAHRGPHRPRRDAPPALARGRPRQRHREDVRRARRDPRPARRVEPAAGPPSPLPARARHPAHGHQGRRVDGHLSFVVRGHPVGAVPAGSRRRERDAGRRSSTRSRRSSTPRRRRTTGSPSTRSTWEWPCDIVPAEVPDDHPIVATTLDAAAALGRAGKISGLDSWHDAAVFTRVGATPTISFGPGDIANGAHDRRVRPRRRAGRPRRRGGAGPAALVRRRGVGAAARKDDAGGEQKERLDLAAGRSSGPCIRTPLSRSGEPSRSRGDAILPPSRRMTTLVCR